MRGCINACIRHDQEHCWQAAWKSCHCLRTKAVPSHSNVPRFPAKSRAFPAKTAQGKASAAAEKKDEEPAEGLDVYLTLINGVVGRNKELKYDNGALQYFFGVPPALGDAAKDAAAQGYSEKVCLCVSGGGGG
jgi:hypothetical protein